MDIARYIGLFLLKNKYAYIHGLGNLELTRKPASHDGQALNAPQYDVNLTPGGSIDDTLANFIATHEQTSISKAANSLRDFATAARADLAAGKEVIIPSLGKFTEDAGGIHFITDPSLDYTPTPIPVLRSSKRLEEAPTWRTEAGSDDSSSNSGNGQIAWGKIAVAAVILILLCAGGYFGWKFYNKDRGQQVVKSDTARPAAPSVAPVVADTTHRKDTTTIQPPQPRVQVSGSGITYVLGTYPMRATAEKRYRQLTSIGKKVELRAKDSSTYFVVMTIENGGDTTTVKDSLRRIFNPKGVSILR